jgi:hypothetical protein
MTITAGHFPRTRARTLRRGTTGTSWLGVGAASLILVGLCMVLIAAWGGIVPYVGPIFGFSADGTGSWTWNLAHWELALLPGAVALVMGLAMMGLARASAVSASARSMLWVSGLVAVAAGAWFVVGPLAWPVLHSGRYFTASGSPLRQLEYVVGYSFGPGLLLVAFGAFAMGRAHRMLSGVDAEGASRVEEPATITPAPEVRESES